VAAVELLTNVVIGGQTTSGFNALAGRLETLGATADRIGSVFRGIEKESVEVYRSYEDNMLAAEYALSAQYTSASELDRVMQGLDKHASGWAANSIFHTSDVSQAINEASHAGWDYEEMIEGIPQAMLIAQAGALDLSTGLDYLVKMMNATDTEFEDSQKVVDQWSKAANLSATGIGEMGEAFMSMGAAAQFGDSTEELFTLLAVLANVGTVGSQAGTAVRSAMMRIIAPTSKAEDAMELLGADVDELEEVLSNVSVTKAVEKLTGLGFSAYDTEGKLKPIIDIFSDMHTALLGLDEASRNEILAAIFPTRTIAQAKAFLAAIDSGKMMELYTDISNSEGYAAKGAEIMMSGLTGSTETLASKFEELERRTGSVMASPIETASEALGGILDGINNLDEPSLSALVGGITTIAAAGPAMMAVGGAIRLFTTLGPVGTTVLAVATGVGALVGYASKLNEINFKENFGTMALDLDTLGEHVDSLKTKFDGQQAAISEWETALATAQETYATKSSELSEMLLTDVLTGKTLSKEDKDKIYGYADDLYKAVWTGLENAEASDMSFLQVMFGDRTGGMGEEDVYNTAANVVSASYQGLYAEAEKIGRELRNSMTKALQDGELDEAERQAIQSTVDRLNEIQTQIASTLDAEAYYEQLYKAQSVSWDSISEYMEENASKQESDLAALDDTYAKKWAHYRLAYDTAIENGTEFTDLNGEKYTIIGYETEDDPHSWAAFEREFNREKEEARQSIIAKYGQLDAAAFDALMNDSEFSTGWNYLKWMQQNGVTLYDENGNLNSRDMGLTPELAKLLGDQLNGLANSDSTWGDLGKGRLTEVLKPFADNPIISSYISMLDSSRGIGLNIDDYLYIYESEIDSAQSRLNVLYARRDQINQEIQERQTRLDNNDYSLWQQMFGATTLTDRTTLYGDVTESEAASGIFKDGSLFAKKQQVEVDISEAEEEIATLQAEYDAMQPSLTVVTEIDSSAVDEYEPGFKTMGVVPSFMIGHAYADGGRATEPSVFGEAGPEWAIPEEHSQRTADLLNAAREASGFTWSNLIGRYGGLNANAQSQSVVITYSPTINAQNADGVDKALALDKARIVKLMKEALSELKMRNEVEVYT